MPAISFSGTTSRGPFWAQILLTQKTQTCRTPRKRPLKVGDKVTLYWKQRVPKDKKPVHLIARTTITEIETLKYRDFAEDDIFARRDGFRDHKELQQWFGDPDVYGDEVYNVIKWNTAFRMLPIENEYKLASSFSPKKINEFFRLYCNGKK